MELATRADLAEDAPLDFPEQPGSMFHAPEPQGPPTRRSSNPVARRSRRRRVALLVLAATLSASGALAALSNRRLAWQIWSRDVAPAIGQATVPSPASKGLGRRKAFAAVAVASTPLTSPEPQEAEGTSAVSSSGPATAPPVAATESRTASVDPPAQQVRALGSAPRTEASSAAAASSAEGIPSGLGQFPLLASETLESAAAAASLFAEASRARREGNTGRALTLYRQLQRVYPSSPESRTSVALSAKLMLDRGDAAAAAVDYDRYLHDGDPILNAEALVGRARAIEQLGQVDAAAAAWREVRERFPGSVHARLAAARLAALGVR